MKPRSALVVVVLAAVAGSLFVSRTEPEPEPAQPPVVLSEPDASVPAVAEVVPALSPPTPALKLEDPFCSSSGGDSFKLRFSLQQLVNDWIRKQTGERGGVSPQTLALVRARQPPVSLEAVREVATRWPDFLAGQVLLAFEAGHSEEGLAALRRARKLAPEDPAIGWAIAKATSDSGELDEAIEGLSTMLARDPIPAVSRLRARLEVARDIQRGYERATRNGVTILWPASSLSASQADQLAGLVDRALDDAAALTGTERRKTLTVVVYPSRSELLAVSCARAWAGGLYDGTLRLVATVTAEGVDLRALRHETLHAQLTPLAPGAPNWFDEGVAQSFAQEPPPTKVWALMVKNHTWVPFTSLDGSFRVFEGDGDAALAYAQSYGLVELMRELGGDASIVTARAAFQSGADTSTALARACRRSEVTGEDLLTFLSRRLSPPR